jgi:hypothetical protein
MTLPGKGGLVCEGISATMGFGHTIAAMQSSSRGAKYGFLRLNPETLVAENRIARTHWRKNHGLGDAYREASDVC